MRNQPRDVTGGDAVLSQILPGLGFVNYLLGWFAVPAEVLLRRNFGERYFTRANFIAGLILLFVFHLSASILGAVNPLTWFFGRSNDAPISPWMGSIIRWYFYIGVVHFLHIWWNDIMGQPVHSFSAGRSWLRPLGRAVMWALNLLLELMVHLLVRVLPGYQANRLEEALPVLTDVDTFTERFIEPLFLFILALFASSSGQTSVFIWLLFSVMALNLSTGMRHTAERSYVLDIRDQLIEARQLRDAMKGGNSLPRDSRSTRLDRAMRATAKEAQRNPDVMDTIRKQHPSMADAIDAMNARKQKAQDTEKMEAQY